MLWGLRPERFFFLTECNLISEVLAWVKIYEGFAKHRITKCLQSLYSGRSSQVLFFVELALRVKKSIRGLFENKHKLYSTVVVI